MRKPRVGKNDSSPAETDNRQYASHPLLALLSHAVEVTTVKIGLLQLIMVTRDPLLIFPEGQGFHKVGQSTNQTSGKK